MRAMILAAGFGTRMGLLSKLRAKPALPVRGRPVISLLLAFLERHGIEEVMINLHHLPETIRAAVQQDHPQSMRISWSEEPTPLGTGGGIRRAAAFLAGSDDCVVLAGDMLLDLDLAGVVERHRASGRAATLVLREDDRMSVFGSVGLAADGRVLRIGSQIGSGIPSGVRSAEESAVGLFTGVRVLSRAALDHWPDRAVFEDLRDWLVPAMRDHGMRAGGEILDRSRSVWEPVGTPREYLQANLEPPGLPSLGGSASSWQGEIRLAGEHQDVLLGRKATLGTGARLERAVVWENESVPPELMAHDGVFAGGRFHSCAESCVQPCADPASRSPS